MNQPSAFLLGQESKEKCSKSWGETLAERGQETTVQGPPSGFDKQVQVGSGVTEEKGTQMGPRVC